MDAELEAEILVGDAGLHGERGAHRVGGIAERGHDRVADGLHHPRRHGRARWPPAARNARARHCRPRHRPAARRAPSSRAGRRRAAPTWLTPASSPGRRVAAAKRSRKACSEITSGTVSASRVQVRSSISAASSKPASFTNSMVPPPRLKPGKASTPDAVILSPGNGPPSCSTSTVPPGWSVRSR